MQTAHFLETLKQYSKADAILFELIKSISELQEFENDLFEFDIEMLASVASALNSLIMRNTKGFKNRALMRYRIKPEIF